MKYQIAIQSRRSPVLASNYDEPLAILGGPAAAGELSIPDWPQLTDRSEEEVLESLQSGAWCSVDDAAI